MLRKMDLGQGEAPAEAAHAFAQTLHDSWGVGDPACQNGVLFLLAVDDRQVYISTGAGAQKALPDARVASVIRDIRPQLRDSDYDGAVKRAIVDVGLGLAGGHPKGEAVAEGDRTAERRCFWFLRVKPACLSGAGGDGEGGIDWFAVGVLGVLGTLFGRSILKGVRRRRDYRACKRMLAKLKRVRALALAAWPWGWWPQGGRPAIGACVQPASVPATHDAAPSCGACAGAGEPEEPRVELPAVVPHLPRCAACAAPAEPLPLLSVPACLCCASASARLPLHQPAAAHPALPVLPAEDFNVQPPWKKERGDEGSSKPSDAGASTSAAAAGASGLDEEAGPLLGGGGNSDEEFSRMSAAGRAAVQRLRQRRRGASDPGASAAGSGSGWAEGAGPSTSPASGPDGRDGRRERVPVTLGCGHTFCEPCIEQWLDKGTNCPVCRRPISDSSAADSGDDHGGSAAARQRLADDWLATDLAFRLAVLQHRYPTFITPAMVDTWSSEAHATGGRCSGLQTCSVPSTVVACVHCHSGSNALQVHSAGRAAATSS